MHIWEGLTSASSAKHAPNWGHFPCPPSLSLTISKQSSTIPNNCTDNSWRSPMLPKICSIFYAKQASLQLTGALIKHCTVDSDMTHLLWVPAGILAQAFSVNLQDTIGSVNAGTWPPVQQTTILSRRTISYIFQGYLLFLFPKQLCEYLLTMQSGH